MVFDAVLEVLDERARAATRERLAAELKARMG
jgi:hypothetical protein